MSHYLPVFTERNGRQQKAACGTWIEAAAHSTTPSCPTCQAYLGTVEADEEATARALEAEFPEWKGRLAIR